MRTSLKDIPESIAPRGELYSYINMDRNYSLLTGTIFRLGTFHLQYSAEKTQIQEKDVDKFRAFYKYTLRHFPFAYVVTLPNMATFSDIKIW